jgi:SAM-dependent methyltransferase
VVDPMLVGQELSASRRTGDTVAISGDYQYRAITCGRAPQRFWHEFKLREAARWINPRPGNLIPDVGCGSGVFADRLAAIEGVRIIGIDGNEAAISFAKGQYKRPNLEFHRGLVDELEFEACTIDRIAFLEVIEHIHVHQGLKVLQSFHRLLKPGGRVVVSTPNYRSLWPIIEWLTDRLRLTPNMGEDQHVAFYNCRSLAELGKQAGFRISASRTINLAAPWFSVLGRTVTERVHRWETAFSQPLGSVIVMAFEKPAGSDQ